ncbi:MAG: TetR/AcrR family transcriptional regulator [Verrucomicrobia bacterium]|nr:TetR/AcrR family transcriptional regulator [Verrucomicrobiota bacterium]
MAKPINPAPDSTTRARIVATARHHLFTFGYSALTMDELARELGVSKKTLYVHFRSKNKLAETILDDFSAEVRALADGLFADRAQPFATKFRALGEAMVQRFSRLTPHMLRDLQRFAPKIYTKIDEMRRKNIPYVFGQVIREGQAAGAVRADIDPQLAIEFWRFAITNLMQPEALERLGMSTDQVFRKAINLFFAGLLTSTGRKEYEKHNVL